MSEGRFAMADGEAEGDGVGVDESMGVEGEGKRRQIAEILHSNRKSGSRNRTAVSKFTPEVHK